MAGPMVGSGIKPTGNIYAFDSLAISFNSTGDNIVIPAVAGKGIRVFRIFFVCSAATAITIKNGATSLTGAMSMSANGGFTLDFQNEAWFYVTTGNDFILSQSGTATVAGAVYYQQ